MIEAKPARFLHETARALSCATCDLITIEGCEWRSPQFPARRPQSSRPAASGTFHVGTAPPLRPVRAPPMLIFAFHLLTGCASGLCRRVDPSGREVLPPIAADIPVARYRQFIRAASNPVVPARVSSLPRVIQNLPAGARCGFSDLNRPDRHGRRHDCLQSGPVLHGLYLLGFVVARSLP